MITEIKDPSHLEFFDEPRMKVKSFKKGDQVGYGYGSIITNIDGVRIKGEKDLKILLTSSYSDGDRVTVTTLEGRKVSIVLSEYSR
jgi:S1-C subfamily serine protease